MFTLNSAILSDLNIGAGVFPQVGSLWLKCTTLLIYGVYLAIGVDVKS